ncbi:MAG: lysyl oxidase family protein [Chitinophagales bacterium]|nr:lysyl oxidase family protein [Chitinophagales bacterium]
MHSSARIALLSLFAIGVWCTTPALALTCGASEVPVHILIDPDSWPGEISWDITDADGGIIASGDYNSDSTCVVDGECYTFHLYDSYGDGIYSPHGVELYYDNELVAFFTGDYDYGTSIDIGCPPGTACSSSIEVTEGTYTAPAPNSWYEFTPAEYGTYIISTCDLDNTCNTQLWVYDHCDGLVLSEYAEGTVYYNDDACGEQAEITGILLEGETYYIRVGDLGSSCEGTSINWSLTYAGPPSGCTDPYACNYSPLATVDDGTCIYPGSPDCPAGPDLVLDSTYFDGYPSFTSDFSLESYDSDWDDCAFEEACVTGTGIRYVLKFGVKIKNIGDVDYHLGSPTDGAPGFVYSDCHNHWHYADYGEYLLYDSLGNEIPSGHKNGYAVMDVGCFDGTPQYGGWNMGISAGCYDIYGRGTSCQWVDLTDVPDGQYTLVARINWENNPDIDGHVETDLSNNWASICILIERDEPGGEPTVTRVEGCTPYYDCYGEIFGSATYDCNGICNGPARIGDLDLDGTQTSDDVTQYTTEILDNTILAATCNDANNDSDIDVYDATLVNGCAWENLGVTHVIELCDLPYGFNEYGDTVTYSIGEIDPGEGYLDIYSVNTTADILAFQLKILGITTIDSVVPMAESIMSSDFRFAFSNDEIIGIGYDEIGYEKNYTPNPVARVYFQATYPTTICLDYITNAVNEAYHEIITAKDNGCFTLTGLEDAHAAYGLQVSIQPHPVTGVSVMRFSNPHNDTFELRMLDLSGRMVSETETQSDHFNISNNEYLPGVYIYQLTNGTESLQGTVVIQ